ncbi:hypothetical protein [Streptomyces sp.]|uniref:hypothetical protein n=1 Tax=Streptomyces sp. TaxID=1931 RepID=UPI002F3FCF18
MADGVDLAAAAVDAVALAAGGAATAAGGAVADAIVGLVRGRLGSVSGGEEAVSAVEQTPEDPDARSRLREKLSVVLSEDPAFAAYLASVLAPPKPTEPPTIVGSINVDRSGRARGTFVLGDHVVTKIRKGDPGALVAVVAVVVVLALVVYGLAQLATGSDWPLSHAGHRVTVLKDPAMVKAVLPDLQSMPTGWRSKSEASVESGADVCRGPQRKRCEEMILSLAQASFRSPYDQSALFEVVACASAADAQRAYDDITQQEKSSIPRLLAMPAFGDQSLALEVSEGKGEAFVRVGTIVVTVTEEGHNDNYEVATLEELTRMAAERAQEAQDGRTPAARADNVRPW